MGKPVWYISKKFVNEKKIKNTNIAEELNISEKSFSKFWLKLKVEKKEQLGKEYLERS